MISSASSSKNCRYVIWEEYEFIVSFSLVLRGLISISCSPVVVNGCLDLLPQRAFDIRGPLNVAVSHWLDVVFIVSTNIAQHWSPQILDFSFCFPMRHSTSTQMSNKVHIPCTHKHVDVHKKNVNNSDNWQSFTER